MIDIKLTPLREEVEKIHGQSSLLRMQQFRLSEVRRELRAQKFDGRDALFRRISEAGRRLEEETESLRRLADTLESIVECCEGTEKGIAEKGIRPGTSRAADVIPGLLTSEEVWKPHVLYAEQAFLKHFDIKIIL